MNNINSLLFFLSVLFLPLKLFSSKDTLSFWEPSPTLKASRAKLCVGLESAAGAGSLSLLGYAWYRDYNTSNFHLFNDFDEWLGMDKLGHVFSSFYIADYMHQTLRWAGFSNRKSVIVSGASSFLYFSAIEVMDGFSSGWGFSAPDMLMNTCGIIGFAVQNTVDKGKNVQMKFGFVPSELRGYRPELLGTSVLESIFKDYNGQSYWLSFNVAHFTGIKKIPSFVSLSFGYGAGGLLGGSGNPSFNEAGQALPTIERYSQFFLSGDIQWTKIKTSNKYLKLFLKALSCYKLPFPTLEYNSKQQFKFNWLM